MNLKKPAGMEFTLFTWSYCNCRKKYICKILFPTKLIGAACLFWNVTGIAQQFNNLTFKCIFIISFVFTIYRLVIIFYNLKQYIVNIYKAKFIVRNSHVNSFNTIIKFLANTAKSTGCRYWCCLLFMLWIGWNITSRRKRTLLCTWY